MLHLKKGEALISDGVVPVLDEWYATMGEFSELQQECHLAAAASSRWSASSTPRSTQQSLRDEAKPLEVLTTRLGRLLQ